MVRSSKLLPVKVGSQIKSESKKTEAALSLYRALKACQSPLALIDALNKTFPKPVYDVFLAIFALHSESEDQIQYPTEAEEREAFFKQWISRGDTICQDQDLDTDSLFIHTPSYNRQLTGRCRIGVGRSSDVLL